MRTDIHLLRRPLTRGSVVASCGRKLVIFGGQLDGGKASAPQRWRKDILVFEPSREEWNPPIKNVLVPTTFYRQCVAEPENLVGIGNFLLASSLKIIISANV